MLLVVGCADTGPVIRFALLLLLACAADAWDQGLPLNRQGGEDREPGGAG